MKTTFAALLILFFGVAVFLTGCSMFAGKVQAETEDGRPLYLNAAGEETVYAVDPETGVANEPVMEYAEDGGLATKGAKLASNVLPSPWGDIAAAGLTLIGTGVSAWAVRENAKRRKERKLSAELVKSIEDNPKALKIVKAELSAKHSPELKALIKAETP